MYGFNIVYPYACIYNRHTTIPSTIRTKRNVARTHTHSHATYSCLICVRSSISISISVSTSASELLLVWSPHCHMSTSDNICRKVETRCLNIHRNWITWQNNNSFTHLFICWTYYLDSDSLFLLNIVWITPYDLSVTKTTLLITMVAHATDDSSWLDL